MTERIEDVESALVTGGAGFIGSHLAERLTEYCTVTVYDDFSTGRPGNVPDVAALVEADVRDTDRIQSAVAEAEVVYHHAAQVSVRKSVETPTDSRAVNVDPLIDILEAARGTDTRVVFASSAAIYGHPRYTPIDETHPKQPTSPYGLEKLTGDHYCRLYHDRYDVKTVALRYFNAYGPRQQGGDYSGAISIFRDQAQANDPITVEGDGTQTRDFVHVDDIVQANLRAATTNHIGEAFNIGTGSTITIQELAKTIRDISESNSDIVHVAPREGDIDHSQADITTAQEDLGFEPQYSIRDGLEAYLG